MQEAIRKMTVGASLYEPINVFKLMGPDIGIVDGPFEYLTVGGVTLPLPFTTRMTVVRLSNGDLFLQSPIKFDEALASELQRMGTIRHLVSPNQFHYAHIGEWSKAFPDAIPWASPRVRQRARARHIDVTFARDLDFNPPEEWRQDIDQTLFPGGYFKEFIFFHKKSKTLVLTDTIINIELDKIPEPWRTATKLSGMYHPRGQIFFGMRLPLLLQPRKAKAAFAKNPLLATGAHYAQPWPVFRVSWRRSHQEDIWNAGALIVKLVRPRAESQFRPLRPSGPNRSAAVSRLTQMCYPFGRRRRPRPPRFRTSSLATR